MVTTILAVARKELREALRDRRSLASGLLYGVWGPLVMALALTAVARHHDPDAPLTLAVDGRAQATSLMAFLTDRSVTVMPAPPLPADRVRARTLPLVLVVGEGYSTLFQSARPARVHVLFDSSWGESKRQADRVKALLAEYQRRVADARLVLRGVSPTAVSALDVAEDDLSTPSGRAASALAMLPIFLLLATVVGGLGVASDIAAGERERGSLESLLVHPAPRIALVLGKWLAVVGVCLTTLSLTLVVSQVVLRHPRIQAIDLPLGLSAQDTVWIWLLLAPLGLLTSALQLLIAFFARTYKEAQTHLSLMTFVPMVPGFLFAFGSVQAAPWMTWAPMLGQHVMITDLIAGRLPSMVAVVGVTVVTLAAAVGALAAAARVLDRESIVRRIGG